VRTAWRAHRSANRRKSLEILHEDPWLIVVNKPAGLLSVPLERNPGVPSVLELLVERFRSHGKKRPFVVHRIDQDSSGLVIFARDAVSRRVLIEQFRNREPERIYRAVVHGHVHPSGGTWRDRLVWDTRALIQKAASASDRNAEDAESQYRVLELLKEASLLEVRLVTGRRNQIRIQAAMHDHPLVGERRYTSRNVDSNAIRFERQALHAFRLTFRHPRDSQLMTCEAPLPPDLVDLMSRLRLKQRTGERRHD
jgi:23S rRNA pseudouridine1911/1915/1917 synthase